MENMGATKVNDILSHSGVKGMKWGVTAAKSTPRSIAKTNSEIRKGYTPQHFSRKNPLLGINKSRRWRATSAGSHIGNSAVAGVLLATGKFSLVKAGIVATSATAATAGTAALIGGAVAGGVIGNRIARKYGKRKLSEMRKSTETPQKTLSKNPVKAYVRTGYKTSLVDAVRKS